MTIECVLLFAAGILLGVVPIRMRQIGLSKVAGGDLTP